MRRAVVEVLWGLVNSLQSPSLCLARSVVRRFAWSGVLPTFLHLRSSMSPRQASGGKISDMGWIF